MFIIKIFNWSSMKTENKRFNTKEDADAFYEKKKNSFPLACEPREKWFTYINSWGNKTHVQKMY